MDCSLLEPHCLPRLRLRSWVNSLKNVLGANKGD